GFRAWPAASVHYDGTWVIRLTAGHAAKRLNSVNPLDPGDTRNLDERIVRAARRFEAYGRPLVFRMSPLAGPALEAYFDDAGWSRFSESLVMAMRLTEDAVGRIMDQIPLKDMNRFVTATLLTQAAVARNMDQIPLERVNRLVTASIQVHDAAPSVRPGLSEIINPIGPEVGLFVVEPQGEPAASGICVRDGELAGLF